MISETLLALPIIFITFTWGGGLLWKEWRIIQCEHALFETTHRRLIGKINQNPNIFIEIEENENRIQGQMHCVGKTMKTSFLTLEALDDAH